ncbi:hypothetical protein ACFL6X_07865 [Candidatus Latescibacterota bacterium]
MLGGRHLGGLVEGPVALELAELAIFLKYQQAVGDLVDEEAAMTDR